MFNYSFIYACLWPYYYELIILEKKDPERKRERERKINDWRMKIRSLLTIIQRKQMLVSMTLIALPFTVHIGWACRSVDKHLYLFVDTKTIATCCRIDCFVMICAWDWLSSLPFLLRYWHVHCADVYCSFEMWKKESRKKNNKNQAKSSTEQMCWDVSEIRIMRCIIYILWAHHAHRHVD